MSEPFDYEVLNLPDDYEGKVIATLIKSKKNKSEGHAVLYIHGFFDYFFHPHLAELFLQHHYNFYALDLRKCGRSLLPHQHSNYCKGISEYFEEIDKAIEIISNSHNLKIILLGHSQGGLVCSAYLNFGRNKDKISALVLNSPFFDFNEPLVLKTVIPFFSKVISGLFPFARIKDNSLPIYAQSLHKDYHGEWDFNPEWKPLDKGYPIYFSWLKAISEDFNFIKHQSKIAIPVLVLHSSQSGKYTKWNQNLLKVDGVLNIADIERVSPGLGNDVTIISVANGMHDILLSSEEVRSHAFTQIVTWLTFRNV